VPRARLASVVVVFAGLVPWVLACGGLPLPGASVPAPPPEARAAVEALTVADAGFEEAVDCAEHGDGLAWLAGHADPLRARAGVLVLSRCPVDATAHRRLALAQALGRPEPGVVGAALQGAAVDLAEADPDDPVLRAVAAVMLTHADKGVRFEALEVFDRYPWAADPWASEQMLAVVRDAAPPVVSEWLERVHARSAGLEDPIPWLATARYATKAHLDPGIRGRAALLAARLAPDHPGVRRELRALLADKHPYARSAAAKALADAGDQGSIHLLVGLLGDKEPSTWKMLPWEATDGSTRRLVHKGSHFERVNDAVFRAIEELTSPMDDGYRYRSVSLKYLELDLISAQREAERWYEEHGDALPSLDDPPAPSAPTPDDDLEGAAETD